MNSLRQTCHLGVIFGTSLLVSACGEGGGIPVLLTNIPPTVPALTAPASSPEYAGTAIDLPNTGTSPLTACILAPESATQMFPNGITLDLSPDRRNCRISGDATGLVAPMMLDVSIQATNAVGSSEPISFTITFRSAPVVSNIAQAQIFTQNMRIEQPVVFTSTAGSPFSSDDPSAASACTVDPALPPGLRISLTDNGRGCEITGTPTTQSDNEEYTVSVANIAGTVEATVSLSVSVDPSLAVVIQDANPRDLVLGEMIDPIVFVSSGADPATCTIALPLPLPSGLVVGTVNSEGSMTCQITGRPDSASLMTNSYTVIATSSDGFSDEASVIITVFEAPALMDIATPVSFTINQAFASGASVVFPATGGLVSSCQSNIPLPVGLLVTPFGNTCRIFSTPTMLAAVIKYTITATNVAGATSATVMIAVEGILAGRPNLDRFNERLTFILNSPIAEDIVLPASGGAVSSCTATPALPIGLTLAPLGNTCVISGTPTQPTGGSAQYTITAANDAGDTDTAMIIISVRGIALNSDPNLMDIAAVQSFPAGAVIGSIVFPTDAGEGSVASCIPDPRTPLPMGLVVRPLGNTCVISGTPAAATPTASYTIIATGNGVSVTAMVMIEIT